MNEEKQPKTKMGAPAKRDRSLMEISEMMGIQLSADALCLEDLKGFPSLKDESPKNQAIMACVVAGFAQNDIAKAFGITQPTVWGIIHRIDPDNVFKISPKAKTAFITRMAESRAMSAIASISIDDLMELDADKRANVAQKMMKIVQDANVSKHKDLGGGKMDMILEQMAAEATDAEFTVEEGK